MKIDVHSHYVPKGGPEFLQREGKRYNPILSQGADGYSYIAINNRPWGYGPHTPGFFDAETKIQYMDAAGVDVQAISPPPFFFLYWADPNLGATLSAYMNDAIAAEVRRQPKRFVGLATVPLQDVKAAVSELDRAVTQLGMKGVEIGSNIDGMDLDDPRLWPFYEKAQALDIPIFVHPADVSDPNPRMIDHYLTAVLAFPFDTSIAIAKVVLGGVLERFPNLKICFPHGGGTIPFLLGRLDQTYQYRKEWQEALSRPPSEYLKSFYYDTIVYHPRPLTYLIQTIPTERIVIGTDYPFEIAERNPISLVNELASVPEDTKKQIMETNAAKLLKMDVKGTVP